MQVDIGTTNTIIMIAIVIIYVVGTVGISLWYGKSQNKAKAGNKVDTFMTAARTVPLWIIGILMVSEVIGTPSTVGTAQQAVNQGMAVGWNIVTNVIAFGLFAFVLAPRLYRSGEYTISGAIAKRYGPSTRTVVSLIMIYALLVVNVSTYVSGAAAISRIIDISLPVAAVVTAIVSALYVSVGGFKSIAYVNVLHFCLKLLTVLITAIVGIKLAGGLANLKASMPEFYFTLTGKVGMSTIIAWTIANIGTVFVTQQITQAVAGARSANDARNAALLAAVLCIPIGVLAAVVGVAAKYLFPEQNALLALPGFIAHMNPVLGGIVLTGIVAMVFANSAAVSLAITSLFVKDFYLKFAKPNPEKQMKFTRIASVVVCFLPIPFALFFPGLLQTMFFAKALRTSIAVVAVVAFYLPFFGSGRGASIGLIGAVIGASAWFLLGNPYGIDNTYVAAAIPAIVLIIDRIVSPRRPKEGQGNGANGGTQNPAPNNG